jgi:tetratricopeptide (TPR) repeat protein
MFYDNCLKLEPTNAGHLYQRFQVYLREKKYDEALGDILAATSLEPTFAQGWLQRARLHRALGKCDKAQDDLVHLDTLDPKLGATEKEGVGLNCHAGRWRCVRSAPTNAH